MNTSEMLEKIELHLLRVHHLLQQPQSNTLQKADIEKICHELHQAYELSVVLKFNQSTAADETVSNQNPKIEKNTKPIVVLSEQPVVETTGSHKEEIHVNPSVAEWHPQIVQPPPSSTISENSKKNSSPAMTVAEAKVTFNDKKAVLVKEALADKLAQSKIPDLTKAIALHEKFLFINELFQGDNVPYNAFIEKLNQPQTLNEALITLNEYADNYHWDLKSKTFQKLLIYIQRRHA